MVDSGLSLVYMYYTKQVKVRKTMAKTSIVIDLAYENGISELYDMFKDTEIEFEVLNEDGPGGGWPECQLTGEKSDIRQWLIEKYCDEVYADFLFDSLLIR